MNYSEDKIPRKENPLEGKVVKALNTPNLSVGVEAGLVKGEVAETANASVSETQSGDGVQAQDDSQQKDSDGTVLKDDRKALKKRLLKNAPTEKVMRSEVLRILENKKDKLESDIRKHKRKRNYRMLSLAIMQLRTVVHQLETVAKASYDALKYIWIRVVHKFA